MPVDFLSLFTVLAATGMRFVVVGGLAMVLHGIDRLTADADLVVDLTADELPAAISALLAAGYRPLAPVDAHALTNAETRANWIATKGMRVFSFWDTTHTRPTVDILIDSPVPFDELWTNATMTQIGSLQIAIASPPDLIRLKQETGRDRDAADIEKLKTLG